MARLVLNNTTLFDGVNDAVEGASVVVEGNRIVDTAAGTGLGDASSDENIVDLAGYTVMPGMTTTHFHPTYNDLDPNAPFGNQYSPAITAIRAAQACEKILKVGYTGAIGAGSALDIDASLTEAIDAGIIPGPRLVPCSPETSTTGHGNEIRTPWYWNIREMGAARIADGPEGFRLAVRQSLQRGAQVIKIFLTGGHGVRTPASHMELTREELSAVIETAHSRGAMVRAHIANPDAVKLAVDLGIDIVDHGDGMDESAMKAVVDAGVFVVPSTYLAEAFYKKLPEGSPAANAMRSAMERGWETLMMMHEGGVKLTVGDDFGARGLEHGRQNDELLSHVLNTNISAKDVLTWATHNGAAMARRLDEVGTIEKGKLADLVIVKGNPLEDITILADDANIQAVIKDGVVVAGTLPA
nr:amidohydrolase family protein [Rhodococcus wratislaviensis]GLK34015.1 peptidase M38 [Rhodococcus wratislaviensis]